MGKKKKKNNKKRKREKLSSSIYITGLPKDMTVYEMSDFFQRAGVIATDIHQKGKKMITLYKEDENSSINKGDALITYHQPHSVQLAMDILDETEIRNGYPVHITVATFEHTKNTKKKKQRID